MHTFEITIERGATEHAALVIEHTTPGNAMASRHEGEILLPATKRDELTAALFQPLAYGTILGEALFRDTVRTTFSQALTAAEAASPAAPLRVMLTVNAPDLQHLRWERLCVPIDRGWNHLALNQRLPFSISLPSVTSRRFSPIGRQDLSALVLVAGPADLAAFDVPATVAGVKAAFGGGIPVEVLASGDVAAPPTLDALLERLTAGGQTLLHIVCHGAMRNRTSAIYLEKAGGAVDVVTDDDLLGRLKDLAHLPQFVFLSACESAAVDAGAAFGGLARRLVQELGLFAVVAMTDLVSVVTATELAQTFYKRLREHGEPDLALVQATAGLAERNDILVPALFSRLEGRPLFDIAPQPLTRLSGASIGKGLARVAAELPLRAPVLAPYLAEQAQTLLPILGTTVAELADDARRIRSETLEKVNALCLDALEVSFAALALGQDPPAYDGRQPFRGRHPFRYDDRAFFFERAEDVERLRLKLQEHPFLPVLGPSGSGKTSLVLAGLIPALEQAEPNLKWAVFEPGPTPQVALDGALATLPDPRGVLVVDRFETIFLHHYAAGERDAFIARLLHEATIRRVILTMRTDFRDDCAAIPALRDAIDLHQQQIGPLAAAALAAATGQQAAAARLRFEGDLATTILDELEGEPGAMAVLQQVLLDLWMRRHGRWLRDDEYRKLGGVEGAVVAAADTMYMNLDPDQQAKLRAVFMRLTRMDNDAGRRADRRYSSRRVSFDDLVPEGSDPIETKALVYRLADAGLVVVG